MKKSHFVQELQSQRQLATSQSDINRLEGLIHQLVEETAEKDRKYQDLQKQYFAREQRLRTSLGRPRSRVAGSVSLAERENLLKKVIALKKERDDLYERLKHSENERTNVQSQLARQNDLFERTSAITKLVERYGFDRKLDGEFFQWRPLVAKSGAPDYKLQLQLSQQKEKIEYLEGLTRRQERQIAKMEEENVDLTEAMKEKEAAWKNYAKRSPAKPKVLNTETTGVQTHLPETSSGDDLQQTRCLLNKVRSQIVQLKAEHVIELAKLNAKERSPPPQMPKSPSAAPRNDAEILYRLSDLEANLCSQVEANSNKLEAALGEITRLRARSNQDEKAVVMACVSDLKADLQNRDEQIQKLVSTVKESKDQATSAMEECTGLRKELEKKRVEVQKAQKELQKQMQAQSATREQTSEAVEQLSKKVKSLTSQLEKKNEIHQRLNSRISEVESANSKLLAELQTKKVSTVDKAFVSQLTERIRKLELENAKLRAPASAQVAGSTHNFRADAATGEAQQGSEEDLKLVLKQLKLAQRERDAARKQLLKTDANLKRTEKHNRLLLNRLRLQPGEGSYLRSWARSTPNRTTNTSAKELAPIQLRQELNVAREDNAKLKIRNAKLEASVARLEEQLQQLKMTRPYGPSLDKVDTAAKGKQPSGTTGKTAAELEVVIIKMKSILDRTLGENARLKRLSTTEGKEDSQSNK
uniref:Pfam-B_11092 domain containing protein n=1 Tax=Echinococcus granulosus TaxID=6210 RepID=A0A068WJF6_ECHGR|nr:Pfam-B_11092 domain containing protein [Echinococcus granulosus]